MAISWLDRKSSRGWWWLWLRLIQPGAATLQTEQRDREISLEHDPVPARKFIGDRHDAAPSSAGLPSEAESSGTHRELQFIRHKIICRYEGALFEEVTAMGVSRAA